MVSSSTTQEFPFLHLHRQVEGIQITGFPTVILFPAGKSPKRRAWKTQEGNHKDTVHHYDYFFLTIQSFYNIPSIDCDSLL